jgi:hypothetical protein
MTKVKLNNKKDLEDLIKQLSEDEGVELSFESVKHPISYPCIAIHNYSEDVDFGSFFSIEFVYFNDFHPCLNPVNLN